MGIATLGGIPFRIDPMSVSWSYNIKTSVTLTVGGKVVQVFGTEISDMSVSGKFSSWQEQEDFLVRVEGWIDYVTDDYTRPPLRFTYAPKSWDFLVYVGNFTQPNAGDGVALSSGEIAPPWSLSLFVVEDNGGLEVIKDQALKAYVERLAVGIGWKQTAYNGPMGTQETQEFITGTGLGGVKALLTQGEGRVMGGAPAAPASPQGGQ